jgi:hypothetical protein
MKNIAFAIGTSYRAIAAVTAVAVLAWAFGLPALVHRAQAATMSQVSDKISDSDLGVAAAHRITFTTPNGMTGTVTSQENMRFTFDPTGSAFDTSGFTTNDIYVVSGATKAADAGACPAPGGHGVYFTLGAGDYYDMTVCAQNTVASGTTMVIDFGTTTSGTLIHNPATASSYVIRIAGASTGAASTPAPDAADTRVAIIDDVTVTAAVDTVFTFSINGVNKGVTVNNDAVPTSGTSTATSVPFGVIAPGTPKLMAQELRVDTNAYNGFSVSVFADQTLTAGNGATIDPFIDGAETASSTIWTSPAGVLANSDTWGHWGLTSDDDQISGAAANQISWGMGRAQYRGDFVGQSNAKEVFYYNHPVAYTQGGMGVGSTTVAYKVEITPLQEAAKDYTATLTYIATPVF